MTDETPHMHMPPVKKELNTNTIIQVVGFVLMIGSLVWTTAQRDRDLSNVATNVARIEARTTNLETTARRFENLEYRVTVQEQGAQTLARAVEELKDALSDQGSDLRVIKEIVTRLDERGPSN